MLSQPITVIAAISLPKSADDSCRNVTVITYASFGSPV